MRSKKIKLSLVDRSCYWVMDLICVIAVVVTAVPFLHVFVASISDIMALVHNKVFLWPVGFDLSSYKTVLTNPAVWKAYGNTVWFTVVGTLCSLFVTITAAYPLSRKTFRARRTIMLLFSFTMYFSGGLVPTFMLVKSLGLYGSRWAIVIPSCLSVFNLIICKTAFEEMPEELLESARLDGCNDFQLLGKMVLPLQKAITAVLALYYGVGYWNTFFNALMYLPDKDMQPLQMFLRRVVILSSPELMIKMGNQSLMNQAQSVMISTQLKFAVVIVTIGPILLIYPFMQKYFIKGVMIGAIKG